MIIIKRGRISGPKIIETSGSVPNRSDVDILKTI